VEGIVYNRLHPAAREMTAHDVVEELAPRWLGGADRPHVAVNFVASADGRATFQGRSGQLGDVGDREMFHSLRECADAILVGIGTLAVERYGRMIKDPARRQRRATRGLNPNAIACIITRSGNLPVGIPLFDEPEQRVLVFSGEPIHPSFIESVPATVEVISVDRAELTNTMVLRTLRSEFGASSVLCEGGPTIFSALLHEGLVDELFLTVAPKLTGGGPAPAITTGAELAVPLGLELDWVLERAGSLFLRYRTAR
jgi:5-amino-6-(5-phosphoribosylamino)uracil reductase